MTILNTEQVLSAFKNRKSCRYYDPKRKISTKDFEFILELGRLSPSSVGSEPWKFIVVQNQALRDAMKPFAWGMVNALDTASHVVVILAKKMLDLIVNFCWKVLNVVVQLNLMTLRQLLSATKISKPMICLFYRMNVLYLIGVVNKLILR